MKKILIMSVREMYAMILIVLMLLFGLVYTSMALFEKTVETAGIASIIASEIDFTLTSSESDFIINGNSGTITVPAGEKKVFNITITNTMSNSVRYKTYYRFENDITILGVNVGISDISESPVTDLIGIGSTKTVRVLIENNATQSATIEIGVQGGYAPNETIALNEGRNELETIEEPPPTLATGNTWYKGTTNKSTITEINIVDIATDDIISTATESWPAAVDNNKDGALDNEIMCYINGTVLTIAGNDYGKIFANKNSRDLFANFTNIIIFNGANLLDTSNVTNMINMFADCKSLTNLDVSGFNTSNVTSMSGMFRNCYALTNLDVSNFNTSNVTNMSDMFCVCRSLTNLDVSGFNTSNVTSMDSMFSTCSALTSLDVSGFNTFNVTDMSGMFANCYVLTSLDVSNFNTSNVTNMSAMFAGCYVLTSLDVSNFNTSNVTDMSSLFGSCKALTSLDVSNFNTSNVTDMSGMFGSCKALTSLDVSNFNTSNVTDMSSMFSSCSALTSLDVSNFNTSNVTNVSFMFSNCYELTSLDVSNFNTSNVTSMYGMFYNCTGLTSLDISGFDTSNVTKMNWMFSNCYHLKVIFVSKDLFVVSNSVTSEDMFEGCYDLIGGNGTTYNSSYINATYARIDTAETPGYFTLKTN